MLLKNSALLTAVLAHASVESVAGGAAPANPVLKTENKEVSYHFKKEKVKDEKGQVIGEGKKLPSLKQALPVPSAEAILDIVAAGGKGLELLQDVILDTVFERGRQIINDWREKKENEGKEVPADLLKPSDLDWFAIANLPKSERRGLGISDEDFEAFYADYLEVMPKATGKDADRIGKHISIYKKKFAGVRNDKKALQVLKDALALYATATPNLEEQQSVYEYLSKRVDTLLQEDEKVLAEAL